MEIRAEFAVDFGCAEDLGKLCGLVQQLLDCAEINSGFEQSEAPPHRFEVIQRIDDGVRHCRRDMTRRSRRAVILKTLAKALNAQILVVSTIFYFINVRNESVQLMV